MSPGRIIQYAILAIALMLIAVSPILSNRNHTTAQANGVSRPGATIELVR